MNAPSRTQRVLFLFTDVDEVLNKQINIITIVNYLYIYVLYKYIIFNFYFLSGLLETSCSAMQSFTLSFIS